MIKNIVYIGIALIIIAIIMLVITGSSSSSISSSLASELIASNLTISSNSYSSLQINTTSNAYLFVIAAIDYPANLYLFNSTGYGKWRAALSSSNSPNGLKSALSLKGSGALIIYHNVTNATIPAEFGFVNTTPVYTVNQSISFPKGEYYVVVDNTNGSASSRLQLLARIVYLPPLTNSSFATGPLSGITSQINQEILLGLLFFIFFIAGIVVLVYGLIKKPKEGMPQKQVAGPQKLGTNVDQKQIDELYKSVEKRKSGKKRKRLNT